MDVSLAVDLNVWTQEGGLDASSSMRQVGVVVSVELLYALMEESAAEVGSCVLTKEVVDYCYDQKRWVDLEAGSAVGSVADSVNS